MLRQQRETEKYFGKMMKPKAEVQKQPDRPHWVDVSATNFNIPDRTSCPIQVGSISRRVDQGRPVSADRPCVDKGRVADNLGVDWGGG